ncbi:MAG: MOSC domain-containing protein [Pseudomonadales bacterium]
MSQTTAATNAQVHSLFRYPVKSMAGESLNQTALTTLGIPGDRAWAVKDEVRGGIRGGKRFPALLDMQARFLTTPQADTRIEARSPAVRMQFPDGSHVDSQDPAINDKLSAYLGSAVSLWPILPAEALEHYRRGTPEFEDMETELRAAFGRTADEPLPDLSKFPQELFEYESPPGTYFDAYPILIMSRSGLAALQADAPDSDFDVRRFRPNILVDSDTPGYFEDAWAGQILQIGSARLQVELPCPRCVMTTHGFDDLPKDPSIMRTLVQSHDGHLGVYANIIEPGTIQAGDTVTVL